MCLPYAFKFNPHNIPIGQLLFLFINEETKDQRNQVNHVLRCWYSLLL